MIRTRRHAVVTCLIVGAAMVLGAAAHAPAAEPAHDANAAAPGAADHADEHADAAHGEGGGPVDKLAPKWPAALFNLLMFLGLFAILAKFVWPKILEGLRAREDKIREDLDEAEQANARAEQTLEEYQQKLAEAHAESRKLLEQARSDAEELRTRLKADTEAELKQLRERAAQDIDRAKQQALSDLYAHSAELATAVATKILQRQVTSEDTQRLVDESLGEIERLKAG